MSKKSLLEAITKEGRSMQFNVDTDGPFSLEEMVRADDGLEVSDIERLQEIAIGECVYLGMGTEVERVL